MKYLKVLAVAIVCILTFGVAQAQVEVRARAQVGPHHRYHHRYHHLRYHHHYNHYRR